MDATNGNATTRYEPPRASAQRVSLVRLTFAIFARRAGRDLPGRHVPMFVMRGVA